MKSSPIKIDFKEFSGEPEDWTTWSKVHRAQLSALGCADAPTDTAGDKTKVNCDDFDRGMELEEHPWRKLLLCVDQILKELEQIDQPMDPKDIDIVILSGLSPQYDAEVRMLESSSDWPKREWIECAVINQYGQLESEESAAGSRAMLSPAATAAMITPPSDAPFAPAQDTLPCNTANSRSPAVRRNRTDIGGMENIVATVEAAEMAEVAEMAEAAKAAEWAAIVEAEAVKTAAGAAVSKRKVAKIPNPAIRPLVPTVTLV